LSALKLWDKPLTMLLRISVLLVLAYLVAGPTVQHAVTATLLPQTGLNPSPIDPRVRFDPGTDALAQAVARLLPQAVAQLQAAQGTTLGPFEVRIYASAERYSRLGACPPGSRGCTFRGHLSLAPGVSVQPEFLLPLVTHELSHVVLQQRMGMMKASRIPPWFAEGLAVLVSGGGGAENVTADEARRAILAGQSFTPTVESSLLHPASAHAFGLDHRMFYRQSALLVAYLRERTPQQFQSLMLYLHAGGSFEQAFTQSYPQGIAPLWADFTASLSRSPS